ncbi:MAG TPA: glutaredoxin domain-containing protein [Mycobacteriales bacterium]|nr:glutaredoxin domain-containing protein [Mycobacteriales bacterium]
MSGPDGFEVLLYWRPGCPFCGRLRRDLRRTGLPVREINIWRDPAAAAVVRSIADGTETVPTVVIGTTGLVNPRAGQVIDAVRAQRPELVEQGAGAPTGGPVRHRFRALLLPGASVALAAFWLVVLALSHPTTTYHLAPLLTVLAWPALSWWRHGRSPSVLRSVLAVLGGVGVTLAAVVVLAAAHALRGPTLTGSGSALVESVLAGFAGAALGLTLTLPRSRSSGSSATGGNPAAGRRSAR